MHATEVSRRVFPARMTPGPANDRMYRPSALHKARIHNREHFARPIGNCQGECSNAKPSLDSAPFPKSRQYVNEVLDFGFHNASSPGFHGRLEKAFAAKFGVKYAIHHANGTATMHSALIASGIGAGDEVIVPDLTMASTALVALYVNAVPIFADVDPETWTISVEDIRRKLTPRTKAIIPVSIYGLPPDYDPIMALPKSTTVPAEVSPSMMIWEYKTMSELTKCVPFFIKTFPPPREWRESTAF